jgi:GNAT superfamily N-acetyltransferase
MTDDEIKIERIKIKDLLEFTRRVISTATDGQFIPITLQRAEAHAHNPLADPEDVALLVATHGRQVVGFFGIMPICLKLDQQYHKVHWFSTWRVMPSLRGKSLGSLLMKEALALQEDFMIVGAGPARKVCRKFGFWEHAPLVYYQLDLTGMGKLNPAVWLMRLLRRLLRPFKVRLAIENRFTRATARLLSPLTRRLFTRLVHRSQRSLDDNLQAQEVASVRPETADQLASLAPVQFWRGAEVVNWMLQYPWVLEPGQSPTERMDFYFSDVRRLFKNVAVELAVGGEYRGYVAFQVTAASQEHGEVKTLDVSLADSVDQSNLLPLALRYARQYHASLVSLPEAAVDGFRKTLLGKMLLLRRERIYQCMPRSKESPLAQAWERITFTFSDGDMPFS